MTSAPYISCRSDGLPEVIIVLLEAIINPILKLRIWVLHFMEKSLTSSPPGPHRDPRNYLCIVKALGFDGDYTEQDADLLACTPWMLWY